MESSLSANSALPTIVNKVWLMKNFLVLVTMVAAGIGAFSTAVLSHGKTQNGEDPTGNLWFDVITGIVFFCIPPVLMVILDRLGLSKWWGLCLSCFLLLVFTIGTTVIWFAWE